MEKGLVSIGLPTYNGEKYLKRSLDSLLGQTYKDIELIVSDDSSSDGSYALCEKYAKNDNRIRLIRHKARLGQFKNFRFLAEEARGEYFMWAAQDDWWDSRFIEVLKKLLDTHSDYGVAMSSYARVGEGGEFLSDITFDGKNNIAGLDYADVLEMMMKNAPIHKFSYGLFRTELIKKVVSRPFPRCIAWERVYMCEIAAAAHFYSHPEILYKITTYRKSLKTRHGKNDVAKPYYDRWRYTKYALNIIWRLFTSPVIPLQRKLFLVPCKCSAFLWFGKGRIFHEISPRLYKVFVKSHSNMI